MRGILAGLSFLSQQFVATSFGEKVLLGLLDFVLVLLVHHLGDHDKSFANVHISLCRSLNEVLDVILFCKPLTNLCGDLTFRFAIGLVPHKDNHSIGLALTANLIKPMREICEAGQAGNAIGQ